MSPLGLAVTPDICAAVLDPSAAVPTPASALVRNVRRCMTRIMHNSFDAVPSFRPLLWLVATAVFMQMLDTTIVNTALPSMAAGLNESPFRMQAIVTSYALTVAMLIPASGWLADRLGTRRVFVAAIVLFTLGSLACAASGQFTQLVAARVLQGAGGAMLLPVGRLAVLRVVPRSEFLAAMSFVTLPGLIGPLVGPTLGGWLVQAASWHWIFLINLPLGVVGTAAALRYMPDLRQSVSRFDVLGYGLLASGMVAVSLSLGLLPSSSRIVASCWSCSSSVSRASRRTGCMPHEQPVRCFHWRSSRSTRSASDFSVTCSRAPAAAACRT